MYLLYRRFHCVLTSYLISSPLSFNLFRSCCFSSITFLSWLAKSLSFSLWAELSLSTRAIEWISTYSWCGQDMRYEGLKELHQGLIHAGFGKWGWLRRMYCTSTTRLTVHSPALWAAILALLAASTLAWETSLLFSWDSVTIRDNETCKEQTSDHTYKCIYMLTNVYTCSLVHS